MQKQGTLAWNLVTGSKQGSPGDTEVWRWDPISPGLLTPFPKHRDPLFIHSTFIHSLGTCCHLGTVLGLGGME